MNLERIAAKSAAALAYPVCSALAAMGLRRRPDPWRRTLGVGLRTEGSKPGLAAFGLRFPVLQEAAHGVEGLADAEARLLLGASAFLDQEPDAHIALDRRRSCDVRVMTPHVDVTLGRFDRDGRLTHVRFRPNPKGPPFPEGAERRAIEESVLRDFNETKDLPEVERGLTAQARLDDGLRRRVLTSALISVEEGEFAGSGRFVAPDFRRRRSLALGPIHFVFRMISSDEIDCWLQLHHVGGDGASMQEMFRRLEVAWGPPHSVVYPDGGSSTVQRTSMEGERELWLGQDFIDFQPLLDLRAERGGDIPVAAWLLWRLAEQPEFAGVRFAVTADVPARGEEARGVDLISVRPADFADIADFAVAFRGLIEAARERRSPTWRVMREIAVLPARVAAWVLRTHPDLARETFGTVGVTILRDAKVVVAPMSDFGFEGGFIAVGNLALPRAEGRTASVTVKGTSSQAASYPEIIRRVMAACRTTP